MPTEFRNEPLTDFSKEENAQAMRAALEKVKTQLGNEYPLVIGGERIQTNDKLESFNPANRTQLVGKFQKATKELANRAVETAYDAFQTWRHVPAEERAWLLFRVAEVIRSRKHELSAWMIHEVAKSWPEADGDTAEAIDFLEFYAREMLRYADKQPLIQLAGEDNNLEYIPLGVGAVIPPWNFPLAIMAGMTAAAVVTGNTVVLKPSSDAPTIAYKFFELLEEAGMPPSVVNFMTGSGAQPKLSKASSGLNGSLLRWAAKTQSSLPTTRTWMKPPPVLCNRPLGFRVRSALPAHERSSMRAFMHQ